MDPEKRSLPPNVKAVLLAKLGEYKSDLNNLKTEVKIIASGNLNPPAQDELLESGMADALMLDGVDNISETKKVLGAMARRMNRNKWIIGVIIAVLIVANLLMVYFKLK